MSFFAELKRRNVIRTGITYLVVSWLLIQVGSILFSTLELGNLPNKILLAFLILGFIPTLLFSWAYEITPEGIKHDRDLDKRISYSALTAKKLDTVTIILVLIAMTMFSVDKFGTKPTVSNTNTPLQSSLFSGKVNTARLATLPSIAVLAFDNLSDSAENVYFSEGISEEILIALAKIKELRVVSRSSSFSFKGQHTDIREIGQQLKADHILEGSVRRLGDQVRISAQLTNTQDGYQVWSDVFNREIDDLFKVQEEIAKSIVTSLQLNVMDVDTFAKVNTKNIEAYDLYLQGRAKLRSANIDKDYTAAVDLFDQALSIDSLFAEAHAGRCEAFTEQYTTSNESSLIDKATQACQQAIALQADAPQVLVSQGELFTAQGLYPEAEKNFRRAIELQPTFDHAYRSQAVAFNSQSKTEEAFKSINQAIELQPTDGDNYSVRGSVNFYSGQLENAVSDYLTALKYNPDDLFIYNDLGGVYFYLGEFGKAAEILRKSLTISPNPIAYANAGTNYYFQGNYQAAYSMFEKAIELTPNNYILQGNLADACRFIVTCKDKSLSHYQKAVNLVDEYLKINANEKIASAQKALYKSRIDNAEAAYLTINQLSSTESQNPNFLYTAALVAVENNKPDEAVQFIQSAIQLGFPVAALNADPDLGSLTTID